MKNSLLSVFATLLPLLTSAHDFEVDGIYYNITSDTEVEVTFKGDFSYECENEYRNSITIPSTITYDEVTYSVTSIGYSAFDDCENLTAITISESVTSIGKRAFYDCSSLKRVKVLAVTSPSMNISYDLSNYKEHLFYVPQKAVDIYKKTNPWRLLTIKGF